MESKHIGSSKSYPSIFPIPCCRMFLENYLKAHHRQCRKRKKQQQTINKLKNKRKGEPER